MPQRSFRKTDCPFTWNFFVAYVSSYIVHWPFIRTRNSWNKESDVWRTPCKCGRGSMSVFECGQAFVTDYFCTKLPLFVFVARIAPRRSAKKPPQKIPCTFAERFASGFWTAEDTESSSMSILTVGTNQKEAGFTTRNMCLLCCWGGGQWWTVTSIV